MLSGTEYTCSSAHGYCKIRGDKPLHDWPWALNIILILPSTFTDEETKTQMADVTL